LDLNTIMSIERPRHRGELATYSDGDAWLASGTFLFSEPQPHLRRLFDLTHFDWEPLVISQRGLSIAATCKVATLDACETPTEWINATLIGQCCDAFLTAPAMPVGSNPLTSPERHTLGAPSKRRKASEIRDH
jgi:hypothetical protein